jgi:hypothetical protein
VIGDLASYYLGLDMNDNFYFIFRKMVKSLNDIINNWVNLFLSKKLLLSLAFWFFQKMLKILKKSARFLSANGNLVLWGCSLISPGATTLDSKVLKLRNTLHYGPSSSIHIIDWWTLLNIWESTRKLHGSIVSPLHGEGPFLFYYYRKKAQGKAWGPRSSISTPSL